MSEYTSSEAVRDEPADVCNRCKALVVGGADARKRHSAEHERIGLVTKALGLLSESVERIATGALKPAEPGVGAADAQRKNDEVRERRIAEYREALAQGARWRDAALSGTTASDAAVWSDSASVREVPPS